MESNNGSADWTNSSDHAAAGYIIPATSAGEISHCLNAGGMGRQDFETETLIAHSLPADGFDASEDSTGRGVPMIPVAFNLRGRNGGAMPEVSASASLRASAGGSTNSYIAFSAKDHGADADRSRPRCAVWCTIRATRTAVGNLPLHSRFMARMVRQVSPHPRMLQAASARGLRAASRTARRQLRSKEWPCAG